MTYSKQWINASIDSNRTFPGLIENHDEQFLIAALLAQICFRTANCVVFTNQLMSIYNDRALLTPQALKELGFTVKESTYRGAVYNFPDNLDHGGYTIEIQDRNAKDLMPGEHIVMVFDSNGVGQPQTMETVGHIRHLMSRFSKK